MALKALYSEEGETHLNHHQEAPLTAEGLSENRLQCWNRSVLNRPPGACVCERESVCVRERVCGCLCECV